MKRFLPLAIATLLSLPSAAVAQVNWQEITVNAVGDRFMVNPASIQVQGNTVRYWEYRDFRQPNNAFLEVEVEQPVHGAMLFHSVDCTSGVVRLRQLIAHDRNRGEIQRFSYGDSGSLSQPRPGSSAAAVVRHVCAQRPQQTPAPATGNGTP